jgi:drug/metabolite transporter (DMT)-like permease
LPRWLVAALVSVVLWGLWALLFASASTSMPPLQVQVVSTVGLLPVLLALLFARGVWKGNRHMRGIVSGILTGFCGTLGNVAFSAALQAGGEASVITPVTALYPLVTLVLAVVLLRERVNAVQMLGIVLAVMAIGLFGSAGGTEATSWLTAATAPWLASALVALALYGIAGITEKLSTIDISDELSTICFGIAALVVAGGILATQAFEEMPASGVWAQALGSGVVFGFALWIGFAAYRGGKASIVTALLALYPVVTVVLAVSILGESIDLAKGVAIGLALLAGLALSYEKPTAASPSAETAPSA